MKKKDFIKLYCKKSGITEKELLATQVILPCNCGEESCRGWSVVSNDKLAIKAHKSLYM